MMNQKKKVLEIKALNAFYKNGNKEKVQVLKNVSFQIGEGEIVGLVGESGSGKSTLCKAMLGFVREYDGKITHFTSYPQMIFQDPYKSLNPKKRIGWLIEEPLRIQKKYKKSKRKEMAEEILEKVKLSKELYRRYPSELSGGQRQRVSIAMALIAGTKFVIADEALSALDVTVQAEIIKLLLELRKEYQLALLFVSHDLDVVDMLCDRVLFLEHGEIKESVETKEKVAGYEKL